MAAAAGVESGERREEGWRRLAEGGLAQPGPARPSPAQPGPAPLGPSINRVIVVERRHYCIRGSHKRDTTVP